ISAAFTSQGPGSIGLRFVLETRPPCAAFYAVPVRQTEVWTSEVFFSSESGFLQIPPHDGHPCLWLTVPTAESVADFHRQVVAHAGRTTIRIPEPFRSGIRLFENQSFKLQFIALTD
ncbi:MAG: hypothetical protein IK108_05415, partial [Clostridia bacterium]|nr:hypothetical protein [Clostridia bacterium]